MNYLHPDIYLTNPNINNNDNILNAKIYNGIISNTKDNYLRGDIYVKLYKDTKANYLDVKQNKK